MSATLHNLPRDDIGVATSREHRQWCVEGFFIIEPERRTDFRSKAGV
jgi:hypothetical protein